MILPKWTPQPPARRINSFLASDQRHHAAKAVLLRFDRLRLVHQSGYAANVTKPRPAPLHYGSPLRTAGSREASTSPCRAEIGFSPDCPPRSVF